MGAATRPPGPADAPAPARRARWAQAVALATSLVAVIAALVAAVGSFDVTPASVPVLAPAPIATPTPSPSPTPTVNAGHDATRVQRLTAEVARLRRELHELNAIILENPRKALALPLLRRDLERAQAEETAALESLQRQYDSLNDSTQFIVGTLGLAVIGILVTVGVAFVQSGRSRRDAAPGPQEPDHAAG